jgi:pimeloyl-ACP methyl ester carboxylesterase
MTTVETSAGQIDVVERGSGEPVLFIHPFVTNHLHWRKVVPLLEGSMRCITPTFPLGSHERPMRADADLTPPGLARVAVDVLDALNIDKATIVGNDTGGAISQIIAARYPERVSRLVLTSCDAYDVFPPRMFGYLKVVAAVPGATWVLAQSMRLNATTRLPIAFGWVVREPIDRDVMRSYVRPVIASSGVRRDVVKIVKGLNPRHTQEAAAALRKFDGPALIAWGGSDRFFPRRLAERLARDIPRAQLEIVDAARTFVPEDEPRALAELIHKYVGPP